MCHLIVHLISHLLLWKFRMFPAKSRATCATCAPGSQAVLTKASTWSIQNEDVTEGIGVGQVTGIDGDPRHVLRQIERGDNRFGRDMQRQHQIWHRFSQIFQWFVAGQVVLDQLESQEALRLAINSRSEEQLMKAIEQALESCWVGTLFLLFFYCPPQRPESGNKSIGHGGFSTHQIVFWFLEVSNNCCSNGALVFSWFDWSWVNIHATFDTFHGTSTNDVIAWNIWNTMFQN